MMEPSSGFSVAGAVAVGVIVLSLTLGSFLMALIYERTAKPRKEGWAGWRDAWKDM